jgi:hypothetical protein
VQQRAEALVLQACEKWTELWNLVLTQDAGNQQARADVVVDGRAVLNGVPVTTLLFLDKQLAEVENLVSKLPTPDPAEDWTHDPNSGLLRSPVAESLRTTKEPTVLVKYEATDKHPAQTETYMKDVPAGYWRQVLYSGCVQADRKNAILGRLKKLQDAVKLAREQANLIDVERQKAGEALLAFLFAK